MISCPLGCFPADGIRCSPFSAAAGQPAVVPTRRPPPPHKKKKPPPQKTPKKKKPPPSPPKPKKTTTTPPPKKKKKPPKTTFFSLDKTHKDTGVPLFYFSSFLSVYLSASAPLPLPSFCYEKDNFAPFRIFGKSLSPTRESYLSSLSSTR